MSDAPKHDDMREREQTMQRDALLVTLAVVSLLNGQTFSPLFAYMLKWLAPFVAPITSSGFVHWYLASFLASLLVVLVAGVPAALYERMRGQTESSPVSIGLWLGVTVLLTLPALRSLLGQYS